MEKILRPESILSRQGRPPSPLTDTARSRSLLYYIRVVRPSHDPTVPWWQSQDQGRVGSTGLLLLAEATLQAFRARNVPLAPGNRLQVAADMIRDSHELRRPLTRDDPVTAALVADAIRDVWDFYLIARTLPVVRDADLDGKLKVMLREADMSSAPRDLQFEGLVAAAFAMADIPTRPAEPDLRIELDGREWGVAVKRVQSANQLAKRTTQARKQIEAQGLKGLIVVNVDAFLREVPVRGVAVEVGVKVNEAVARLHRLLPDLARQRSLLGVVAMGRIVGWDFENTVPHLFQPWIVQARAFGERGGPETAIVETFFERLQERGGERMDETFRWLQGG